MPKKKILFVCTGNAGRSQIAQVLCAGMAGDEIIASSAGVAPWPHLHPVAVRLLRQMGFETKGLYPKPVAAVAGKRFDWVVTIGDRARDETPPLPGSPSRIHWDIADPADADGTGAEAAAFETAILAIKERLPSLLESIRVGE